MALAATIMCVLGAWTFFLSIRAVQRQVDDLYRRMEDLDRRTHFLLDTSRAVWDALLRPGVLDERTGPELRDKLLALMQEETSNDQRPRDQEGQR